MSKEVIMDEFNKVVTDTVERGMRQAWEKIKEVFSWMSKNIERAKQREIDKHNQKLIREFFKKYPRKRNRSNYSRNDPTRIAFILSHFTSHPLPVSLLLPQFQLPPYPCFR
jgi:DNA-binding transcriptional regulator GbsR (MarR family)